jgi:nucleotide-binding universal stress UspA family protein
MKILIAIDGSACSETVVNAVAQRPWPAGSEAKVITAIDLPIMPVAEAWTLPDDYWEKCIQAAEQAARKTLDQAAAQLRTGASAALTVSTEILKGYPKDVILDVAEAWGADLIVVGSHGLKGLKRFWLGSVSHAVATHATCSVEIVRCLQK